jgi:hypothetical protein
MTVGAGMQNEACIFDIRCTLIYKQSPCQTFVLVISFYINVLEEFACLC